MTTTAPYLVRVVKQDGDLPDCAVATVAMLCGVTYGEALAAFPRPDRVVKIGAYLTELREAVRRFKVKATLRKRFDLEEDTGILYVSGKDEHLVFLWAGRIIDGNGECWLHADSYLKAHSYKAKALLIIQE